MQYIANCAILVNGVRARKGEAIVLDPAVAANLGGDVSPVGTTPEVKDETPVEKAIGEMTHDELKEKAVALGLAKSGSKADLVERITLHQAGTTTEVKDETPVV